MTIKTADQLAALLPDNQERAIVPGVLRDLLDSSRAVGGTMYGSGNQVVMPTWQPFTAFTNSIDTRGLTADLVAGEFVVGPGADGLYSVDATVAITFPASGSLELALTKNGGLTPYRILAAAVNDKSFPIPLMGTGNLVEGDRIGLAIRGSGSATGLVNSSLYRAIRV